MSIQNRLSSNKLDLSDSSTFQGKDISKNNLELLYLTSKSLTIHPSTYTMVKPKGISQINTKLKKSIDKRNFIHSMNFLIGELNRLKQKHSPKKEMVL